MKRLIIVSLILVLSLSLRMESHKEDVPSIIVGAYSPVEVKDLSESQK